MKKFSTGSKIETGIESDIKIAKAINMPISTLQKYKQADADNFRWKIYNILKSMDLEEMKKRSLFLEEIQNKIVKFDSTKELIDFVSKEKNLTIKDIANKINMKPNTLYRYIMTNTALEKIAAKLHKEKML